jgi:GNAT superfamily N-acetyltransferase
MEAVRAATTDDTPRLEELVDELVASLSERRGGSMLIEDGSPGGGSSPSTGGFGALLADPSALVLVGTLDGVITGFATCRLSSSPEGGSRPRGSLDACYVEPDARGVGLGRLLIDASVAWLEEQGCGGVDGVALPGDRTAKNFYESAGFKARMLTMHRELR